MKGYFAKYIPAVFFFSLLFIFINAIISFYNLETLLENEKLVNHSEEVLVKVNAVRLSIKDAEISQRNYLITEDAQHLSSFHTFSSQSEKEVTALKSLVQDNAQQVSRVVTLQKVLNERVMFLQEGIDQYHQEGSQAVLEYIKQGRNQLKSKELENLFEEMERTEKALLNNRNAESISSANRTYTTILIATLLNISLIFMTYFLIKRELDYRVSMEYRKDEFISIATHELKTPITSLQVYAELLDRKLTAYKKQDLKQYSTRITAQVSRLAELVNDLLDVSRLQLGKLKFDKTDFNITSLVQEITEGLSHTTTKHAILLKGKGDTYVYGDADRIGQVLTNLVSNAIKYSPDGKKIIVSIKKDLRFVVVSVQDFGIGISEKDRPHVFERFYRADGESEKNFPGLGMGLYISQEIIRRHRGRLWLTSSEGKGSIFYFTLPYAKSTRIKNRVVREE